MKVYLVQHCEAKREEEDPSRPLTEKGLSDARKVAKYAAEVIKLKVSKILHSRKLRAKQTAEIFSEFLKPEACSEADNLDPLADPRKWAEKLNSEEEDLIIVGHLPHLSKLTSLLILGDQEREIVKFKMGGIVCLERLRPASWVLLWAITPEILLVWQ